MKNITTIFSLIFLISILSFQNSISQYSLTYQTFESPLYPPAGWTTNQWYQASGSGYGIGNYSSQLALYYNCYGNFQLDPAEFSASETGDSLIFDYAYAPIDYTNYYDLQLYYSMDNGQSFYYLYTLYGDPNYGGELMTAYPTTSYFYPQSYDWKTFRFELPEGTTNVKFEAYGNGCSNNLYIDNIKIGHEVPYTDVAVKNVYSKGRYLRTFLSNDTISAYISNEGNQEVTNLKIFLNITGANTFKDSLVIASLPAYSFNVVKFKPFTPVLNGNGVVKVSIIHNDEIPDNDSALYNLNVNTSYLSYTDTTGFQSSHGSYDRIYFLNKHYVTNANSRVSEVRVRIEKFDGNLIKDQVITGVLFNDAGMLIAKSDPYKLQTSDTGKYVSLKFSNPLPYYPAVTNKYFYAGIESAAPIRDDYFFSFTGQVENPMRTNAYFYSIDRERNIGESLIFINDLGSYNYGVRYDLAVQVVNMPAVDAGVSSLGDMYDQYYNTTTIPQKGKVYNNALSGTANATVIRTITPGSYTSLQVVSIPANTSANVTFANWAFTSGTTYSVRDSVILSGDVNLTNNVMKSTTTPRVAKDLAILYQKQEDRDSLIRAIITDGRYVNNYDVIDLNYTGSFRPWKIVFANAKFYNIFQNNQRDSLKAFLDNSTAGNKKTLAVFGSKLSYTYDPTYYYATVGDTIFMRQYLRAKYIFTDWLLYYPESESRFKGNGIFSGITEDSISLHPEVYPGPEEPDLIQPVNGSSIAFLPQSIDTKDTNGNSYCNAVAYSGANYNTFFMSNRFSSLRSTSSSPSVSMGPVRVYSKIIDWIQNINTGVKILDLKVDIEGYYDESSDLMTQDTMRVYLRSSVNPFPKVDSAKAYLNVAGQASYIFSNASNGVGYYIQLKHRNGLETWSSSPQVFSSNQLSYDFTDNSAKAFGNNMKPQNNKWVIFTGDADQNGFVDLTDVISIYNDASAFISGYVKTDVNGNGFTDLTDILLAYNNSTSFVQKNTPLSGPQPGLDKVYVSETYFNSDFNTTLKTENKIDHEIYERFKNEQLRKNINTGFSVVEKAKNQFLIKPDRNR